MERDYLTYKAFVRLCEANGISEESEQRVLIRLLHDLGVVQGLRGAEDLGVVLKDRSEMHSRVIRIAVPDAGLRKSEVGRIPTHFVTEITVTLALAAQVGEIVTFPFHHVHAVFHEALHETLATALGIGGDPADTCNPQFYVTHIPGNRKHPHDCLDPSLAFDRIVARHVLVGGAVQFPQKSLHVVWTVSRKGEIEKIHCLLKVVRSESNDFFALHSPHYQVSVGMNLVKIYILHP